MPERYPPMVASERARQGETSGHMRIVLALSLAGAVIVLAALLIWWSKMGQAHPLAAVSDAIAVNWSNR